jgi:hypothetical protein
MMKFVITFVIMVLTNVALAQDIVDHKQSINEAMQALDVFMVAFNARDPDAWAASLNYPHVRFASGPLRFGIRLENLLKMRVVALLWFFPGRGGIILIGLLER